MNKYIYYNRVCKSAPGYAESAYIFNRPGVAGNVLQTP